MCFTMTDVRIPDTGTLGGIPLFHGLGTADLSYVSGLMRIRRFPASARVIEAEELSSTALIVIDGTVKVLIERRDGSEVFLALLGAGEVVGEMGLVDHGDRSATVVTIGESTLATLASGDFWRCLQTMPQMTYNLLEILSRRLRVANGRIEALASLDVEGRVAQCLLDLATRFGEPVPTGGHRIPFPLSQQDVATLVGASRVRVNQVLGEYRRRHYVAVDGNHRFLVLDPTSLARQCQ
jgi:CRP/FNR family transcriptional regulator, cyclic AMP receptor protein